VLNILNTCKDTFLQVCGQAFDCPAKYGLLNVIGRGAYGVVCSAIDRCSGDTAAIKKVTQIFNNPLDAQRTLRELQVGVLVGGVGHP
jgi:p38 MAP kinase